jgi:hypothetical protein
MFLKDCNSNLFNKNEVDNVTKFVEDYNSLLKSEKNSDKSRRKYRHLCNTYDELFYSNDCSSDRLKIIKESRDKVHKDALEDLDMFIILDKKCNNEKNELVNKSVDYKLQKFSELNKDNDDLLHKYASLESDIYSAFLNDYDNYKFYREFNKKNHYKYEHDNNELKKKYDYIKKLYSFYEISNTDKSSLENIFVSESYKDFNLLEDSNKTLVKKKK